MRLLHLSTTDQPAGASRAALTIHSLLRDRGCESRMMVLRKLSEAPDVLQVPLREGPRAGIPARVLARLGLRPIRQKASYVFNFDGRTSVAPGALTSLPRGSMDALLVHWTTGLVTSRDLRAAADYYGCPVIRVVMDMEPVTGGCHQSFGCEGYRRSCGRCPVLEKNGPRDASWKVLRSKRAHLGSLPMVFVCPNSTVRGWVGSSSVFGEHRKVDIPLPIDGSVFHPGERAAARERLGMPPDGRVIMVGARKTEEPGKGMAVLEEAMARLPGLLRSMDDLTLLLVGRGPEGFLGNSGIRTYSTGFLEEPERMADAYRAADVSVCPSIHDAGPMMIPEAMMCGTPVASFRTGVAVDLVKDGITGWTAASPGDAEGLAEAVSRVLTVEAPLKMGHAAAEAASGHSFGEVGRRYISLLKELIPGGEQ